MMKGPQQFRHNFVHPSVICSGPIYMGSNNYIGPGVSLFGPLYIGNNNYIGAGSVIGTPPEAATLQCADDLIEWGKRISEFPSIEESIEVPLHHETGGIYIGSHNVIRELCVIHRGTDLATVMSNHCYITSRCGINHDDYLHDGVVLAPGVSLAGHVVLGKECQIGIGASIHQKITVGPFTMVGASAAVVRDLPPLAIAKGVPARVTGANRVRMRRWGMMEADIAKFTDALLSKHDIPLESLPPERKNSLIAWNRLSGQQGRGKAD